MPDEMTPKERLVVAALVVSASEPRAPMCHWCGAVFPVKHVAGCAFRKMQLAALAMIDEAKGDTQTERLAA